jgi:hypothetical protein
MRNRASTLSPLLFRARGVLIKSDVTEGLEVAGESECLSDDSAFQDFRRFLGNTKMKGWGLIVAPRAS